MPQAAISTPTPSSLPELTRQILSVQKLLSDTNLSIPQYQRPYKWTARNVNQLFADIATHQDKSSYRLGTVVFHLEGNVKNIVDGQQRTITLLLAARALIHLRLDSLDRKDLKNQLAALDQVMVNPSFDSVVSQANVHTNFLEISRIVARADFSESQIDFLLNRCEVVAFGLRDVSEAFQFFDSQNARGRDLEPHDLLKAYHLREFGEGDETLKAKTVAHWENRDTKEMAALFARYLYRIRRWVKGHPARYFGKNDTPLFKGVGIETIAHYPYTEQLRIAHHFVDHYNKQYERRIDALSLKFPFQLDQIIINGRRFFEMTAHYQEKVAHIRSGLAHFKSLAGKAKLGGFARNILATINLYPGRTRTGDQYVRSMFDCLLIYYIDKFGYMDISQAIEKVFVWAYSLRLQMQVVQLATMDNYVLENNLFRLLKDATHPSEFVTLPLPVLSGLRSTKTEEIENIFREMKYLE